MKTISIIFILAVALLTGFSSVAQENVQKEEDLWLKQLVREYSYEQVMSQRNLNNKAFVAQDGSKNNAIIDQRNTGYIGQENSVYLLQRGSYNSGAIQQHGRDNEYYVIQNGVKNDVEMSARGSGNKTTLYQIGNNNKVKQSLKGDGMNYYILQEGSRHELIQKENGSVNPKYSVEQRGAGMKVIIENSNIYYK